MSVDLINLLTEYGCTNIECVHKKTIANSTVTFLQLRDFLLHHGEILLEDTDNNVYVASLKSGFFDLNKTIVAVQARNSKITIAGYANEGFLKQNSLNKAFAKLEALCQSKKASSKNPMSKQRKIIISALAAITLITISFVALMFGEVTQTQNATKAYNVAVNEYNKQAELYNQAVELTCIDNISGLPIMLETLSTEDEGFFANLMVVIGNNDKSIITADTKTIEGMTEQAKSAVSILKQITVPTSKWVIDRLATVEKITGTQAVTKKLDPDGLLGKEGGFSACVYFTVSDINPDDIAGDTIVAKGTDAGGAIEVYPTVQDAEARCAYLAGFDGTVLYSGSYAIVGTTVIRTSYKLTNEQQIELTNLITMALTSK